MLSVIGASNKTPLTIGSGNKEMHPVLLSLANIDTGVHMKATSHAFALAAYLPIPKFVNVSPLGLATGTGKPAVIGSRVSWVWVWCWVLAHRNIPCTCTPVSWVFHGYITTRWPSFLLFFFSSFLAFFFFLSVTSICHTVIQPNMAMPAACTFSSSYFHHRTPMHSKSYSYN
jgi:hypothetical protein